MISQSKLIDGIRYWSYCTHIGVMNKYPDKKDELASWLKSFGVDPYLDEGIQPSPYASYRGRTNVATDPLAGDIFEIKSAMYRVMAIVEEHVIYKHYGFGVHMVKKDEWKKMIESNEVPFIMYRGGDDSIPFRGNHGQKEEDN